jgi:hypothetical protein
MAREVKPLLPLQLVVGQESAVFREQALRNLAVEDEPEMNLVGRQA